MIKEKTYPLAMRVRVGAIAAAVVLVVTGCSSSGGKHAHGSLEVRPLIMPGRHATKAQPNAFDSLRLPADELAYSRLGPSRQAQLARALSGVDCAHLPKPAGDVRVVCDSDSDAYLLGATIFTAHDVVKATAIPPSTSGSGATQWQVALSLDSAGADRAYEWTSQHHVNSPVGVFNDVQTSTKPPCGTTVFTRCADFLAYISGDLVVSVPVTFAAVQSAVLVSGDFTEASATHFAHQIAG